MTRTLFLFIFLLITPIAFANEVLNVKISGLNGEIQKNAIGRINVEKEGLGNKLNSEKIEDFFQAAPENLRKAIEPFGYFKSKIRSHLIHQGSVWTAIFQVELGQPIHITEVDIRVTGPGQDNPALTHAINNTPLKTGDIFIASTYEKAKDDLFDIANNEGYIKAFLERKEIQINLHSYTVKIILQLNTGPRHYFGAISFDQTGFTEEFLRRFLSFHEGEPFSSQKLLKFQENLSNSSYFQEVGVKPNFKHIDHYFIPVQVTLTPKKAKQYNFGIGYGTFTGPRLSAGVNFRHLTSTGHHMSAKLKYSSVIKGLAATYYIPAKNPLTDQYTLGINAQQFTPENAKSFSQTLSAGYVRNINPWQYSISLNYLNEQFRDFNNPPPAQHSTLLYPTLNLSHIKADNILYPRHGSSINFTVQGTIKNFLSTTNFIQGDAKGKYVFSPTNHSRVILRGEFGYTVVSDIHKLPITLQFFAGGINSIRGYPYTFFGPSRYLEVGSIELEHDLFGDVSGAIFYDKGTASDHFGGPFSAGDGIGLIYRSVVGPIKLYVARAEDKRGKPRSIEFTIGSDF